MTDHLFAATLTFALLAGGTVAVAGEFVGAPTAVSTTPVTQASAPPVVTLPAVTVIGRRPASTPAEGGTAQPQRAR